MQPRFSLATLVELLRLALPMMVSQGTLGVMLFTDRFFLSRIDAVHMAAAMSGGVAAFFTVSLFIGIIGYANALVAQYYGAGKLRRCSAVVTQGMVLSICCLPLIGLFAWMFSGAFARFDHDPEQVELATLYYWIIVSGALFSLIKTCFASYFAGIGRTRVVMICDVLGLLINVPLTYALVFGAAGLPALGIAGAGIATITATAMTIGFFALFYFSRVHRERFAVLASFHFDPGIVRRYLRLGIPSGLELFLNIATFNLFLLMFQSYGVAEGAAIAIVFNWDLMSYVPLVGISIGVMSLIGRFVGAGDMARANQVISAAYVMALTYSGILALCFVFLREPLVAMFAPPGGDFTVTSRLAQYMMIGLASYVMADALVLVASGVLRGAGDTRWLMVTSVAVHWAMVVAQYFVILVFDLGPKVSWWIFVAMIITLAAIYTLRLARGVWRRPERLARVMAE